MYIYFDESVHQEAKFMLIAFVICRKNPNNDLLKIINDCGIEEYHSCTKMDQSPNMKKARTLFGNYINNNCKWGILIVPIEDRNSVNLVNEIELVIISLKKEIDLSAIYFDEGLIKKTHLDSRSFLSLVNIKSSHEECGLQLADLVASLCGIRLRSEITGNHKILTYGKESGFEPSISAPLSCEFWAALRYSMSRKKEPIGDEMPEMAEFETVGVGYFISPKYSSVIKESSDQLFSKVYLGCVH